MTKTITKTKGIEKLSDWTDEASATQELLESVAIANVRNQKQFLLKPAGFCHNCGEGLKVDLLFCDADCRDDWERERAAKRRAGR